MQAILTKNSNIISVKTLITNLGNIHLNSNRLMIMLAIALLSTLFLWLMQPSTLPIKRIHIEGEFKQLNNHHLQALITNKLEGGFFNIDVAAISNELIRLPWVKQIAIHRSWPDSLIIVIKEQVAIARWGDRGFLNEEGDYFSPTTDAPVTHLPVIAGYEGSQKILLQHFNFLKNDYGLNVVHLRLDKRRAWEFELDSGLTVVLGRKDFHNRVKRFLHIAVNGLKDKIHQAKKIDMRYTNGFSVQWR